MLDGGQKKKLSCLCSLPLMLVENGLIIHAAIMLMVTSTNTAHSPDPCLHIGFFNGECERQRQKGLELRDQRAVRVLGAIYSETKHCRRLAL